MIIFLGCRYGVSISIVLQSLSHRPLRYPGNTGHPKLYFCFARSASLAAEMRSAQEKTLYAGEQFAEYALNLERVS